MRSATCIGQTTSSMNQRYVTLHAMIEIHETTPSENFCSLALLIRRISLYALVQRRYDPLAYKPVKCWNTHSCLCLNSCSLQWIFQQPMLRSSADSWSLLEKTANIIIFKLFASSTKVNPLEVSLGAFDWAVSLRNCPVFHSAGAVNPIEKLSNCRELLSESANPNIDPLTWRAPLTFEEILSRVCSSNGLNELQ